MNTNCIYCKLPTGGSSSGDRPMCLTCYLIKERSDPSEPIRQLKMDLINKGQHHTASALDDEELKVRGYL